MEEVKEAKERDGRVFRRNSRTSAIIQPRDGGRRHNIVVIVKGGSGEETGEVLKVNLIRFSKRLSVGLF